MFFLFYYIYIVVLRFRGEVKVPPGRIYGSYVKITYTIDGKPDGKQLKLPELKMYVLYTQYQLKFPLLVVVHLYCIYSL